MFACDKEEKKEDFRFFATGEIITLYNSLGDTLYIGPRYNRELQNRVQSALISINAYDIYDDVFFRLDEVNTDHFYEDIGKYNKYIFGWADWYYTFAADDSGSFKLGTLTNGDFAAGNPVWNNPYGDYPSVWVMSNTDPNFAHTSIWLSNHTITNYIQYLDLVATDPSMAQTYLQSPVSPSHPSASSMRTTYQSMRE